MKFGLKKRDRAELYTRLFTCTLMEIMGVVNEMWSDLAARRIRDDAPHQEADFLE